MFCGTEFVRGCPGESKSWMVEATEGEFEGVWMCRRLVGGWSRGSGKS